MQKIPALALSAALAVAACSTGTPSNAATDSAALDTSGAQPATALADAPFTVQEAAAFNEPWAMTFLPGTRLALVTEKSGKLKLWEEGGAARDVAGVPPVLYAGQGGLGDVILAPDFAQSGTIYLSWAEAGPGDSAGAVVGRAKLVQGAAPRRT